MFKGTERITFLGTPFQDSDEAEWAQVGRVFVSRSAHPNAALLGDLEKNSNVLINLEDSFQ